jgi:phosphohistidine phosphatase SixA
MKFIPLITFFLLLCVILSCNQSVEVKESRFIFLVRHAEKVDESKDAALSIEGIERSNRLKELLAESDIDHIFSTDFQRTRNTVKPLAEAMQLEIEPYSIDTLWEFSQHILISGFGNVLVSGHSNSTPNLANLFIGTEKFKELKHEDYGKLIVISVLGNKVVGATTINY